MAYVGRGLNQTGGQYRKLDDISSGFDGSETGFSLTVDNLEVTPTAQNLMISLNGVVQEPGSAFTVSGGTITFTGAPAASSDFFGVVMGEASYIAYGTVGANEMGVTAGAVTGSKGVVVDSSKNIQGINQVTATQYVGGGAGITGVTAEWDGTHTGNGVITGDFNVTGNVTGSKVSASLGEFTSATIEGGTISGITDLAVADGGTGASTLDNLITLTDHTTGNYVGTLTGGTGITSTGATTGEGIAHSISVDASQTQITGLSTVTTGVWNSTFGSTANALISGSFGNQRVGTTDSPTFADVTATGTVTAQEFHTEFVSSSILYTSGSTRFGNSSDDLHSFTGSIAVSGSISGLATSTGSFGRVEASTVKGTLATAAQTNITSVGTLTSLTLGGDLTIPQKIIHSGDTDTYLSFGTDSLSLYTGGTNSVDFIYGNIYLKTNNKALVGYNAGGSAKELIKIDGSDVVQIGEGLNATFTGNVQIDGSNTAPLIVSADTDKVFNFTSGVSETGSVPTIQTTNTAGSSLVGFGVRASEIKLVTSSTLALTLDASQNATFAGNVYIANNNAIWMRNNADDADTSAIWTGTSDELNFRTGGSGTALTINSSGNATFAGTVGVAGATVVEKLSVGGAISVTGDALTNTASCAKFGYVSAGAVIHSWGANDSTKGAFKVRHHTSAGTTSADAFVIDSSSNATFAGNVNLAVDGLVNFGDTSGTTDRMLIRKNDDGSGEINVLSAHDLILRTGDTTRLTIASGGTATFAGDVRIEGKLELGSSSGTFDADAGWHDLFTDNAEGVSFITMKTHAGSYHCNAFFIVTWEYGYGNVDAFTSGGNWTTDLELRWTGTYPSTFRLQGRATVTYSGTTTNMVSWKRLEINH